MKRLVFTDAAWDDYQWWQSQDRKTLKRLNSLIEDTRCNPSAGIGKPEPLKQELTGVWSRRINGEHRLVYFVQDDDLVIISARYHYTKG